MIGKPSLVLVLLSMLVISEYRVSAQEIPFCLQPNSECLNGGRCTGTGYQAYCACVRPYYGQRCQYEVPEDKFCNDPNKCKPNGHCIKGGDGIALGFCLCKKGYTGELCQDSQNSYCSQPGYCLNGGICVSAGDGKPAQCSCPSGYSGARCEQGTSG